MHIGMRARAYINIIYRSICDRHHMCRIQYYFADGKRETVGTFSFSINVFVVLRHPFSILNVKRTFASDRDVYRLSLLSREATGKALKRGEDENILRMKE